MKKLVIWLVVLAAIGGGGWWASKKYPDKFAFLKSAEPQAKKSGRPTTAAVTPRDISFAVFAAGDIGPADQVSVRPEVSGKISVLAVDIGDKVKKGDVLFSLDDSDLQIERSQRQTEIEAAKLQIEGARLTVEKLQLNYNRTEQIFENKAPLQRSQRQTEIDAAKLQIESARLTLEKSQINFDRTKRLFEDKLLSKEVFENAQAELDQARNNHALASNNHQRLLTHEVLENAKAELDLAKNNHALARNSHERALKTLQLVEDKISKTKILAPFDCTVLTRPVSVGQAVSGSSGVNSGTEVLTIANLADMVITAHINQADVTRLKVGQKVDVEVEAVAGLKLTGTVDRIAPQATIRNSIKGYTTRILLRNADTAVRPGMTANLTIPLASAENVIAVPLAAVFSEKGDRFVYVKKDEKFIRQPILIGVSDYDYCEVQTGLEGGETVSLIQPADDAGIVSAAFQGGKGGKGGKGGGKMGGKGGYKGGGEGGGATGTTGGSKTSGEGGTGSGGKGGRPGGGKGGTGGGKGGEGGSKSNSTGP